jgi:hypothetical protein
VQLFDVGASDGRPLASEVVLPVDGLIVLADKLSEVRATQKRLR